jgi:hypothetical protein
LFKNKLALIGILIGAIGGYLYYPIYGSVMGGLLFSIFKKEKINSEL